jgi:hypothetical protein
MAVSPLGCRWIFYCCRGSIVDQTIILRSIRNCRFHKPPSVAVRTNEIYRPVAPVFYYCLVIVGWFTIRSGERNARNLERAYIFAGPANPTQIGNGVITEVTIENHGSEPGYLERSIWGI